MQVSAMFTLAYCESNLTRNQYTYILTVSRMGYRMYLNPNTVTQ